MSSRTKCLHLEQSPQPSDVKIAHVYLDKQSLGSEFKLGLTEDVNLPMRVYVLQCRGPRGVKVWYVGILHVSELKRFRKHWAGEACHYTKVYPPEKIVLLWPAPSESVEAYVYFEMLRRMPANQAWRLGGFTQTSSNPSRLDCLLAEQA